MSIVSSFSMFFLSFSPLWLSVLFIDAKSLWEHTPCPYTEIISISIILILTLTTLIVLMHDFNPKDTNGAEEFIIQSATEEKTVTSEFLLSYILPLFAFDFTTWNEVVLFLVFFAVFSYLCIRHNHFSVNIVLELLHYRFYSCDLINDDGETFSKTIITQKALSACIGSVIAIKDINNEFAVQTIGVAE